MRRRFTSLDLHTSTTSDYERPDRYRQITEAAKRDRIITRGAGVSYAGASFSENALSIDVSAFNRILAFNNDERWVEVEGAVSLGKLFEFLTPYGLHLAVQPGHPQITIGGCIAANVHGKNQYKEGVFGQWVETLKLFHPNHGMITASRTENAEIFDLTVGGYGLTGIILSARLRLEPLPGLTIREDRIKVGGLAEAFREIDRLKSDYDMIYCWNDLARRGKNIGRGYIVAGKYVTGIDTEKPIAQYKRLNPSAKKHFRPTIFADYAMPWINRLYYHQNTRSTKPVMVPLFGFLFPAVGKEFYFDFFGKHGLIELQTLLPSDSIDLYVKDFLKIIRRHEQPVALTTIKAFRGEQRLLHFNGTGFNFTIEVRNSPASLTLLNALDELNCEFGGITNIIKDSRLRAEIVEHQYPDYAEFRERLRHYDPARRFSSTISERLGL